MGFFCAWCPDEWSIVCSKPDVHPLNGLATAHVCHTLTYLLNYFQHGDSNSRSFSLRNDLLKSVDTLNNLYFAASNPVCYTNLPLPGHTVQEYDSFEISCSVNYSGNYAPVLQCLPETPNDIVIYNVTSYSVVYQKTVVALPSTDATVYQCTTYFNATDNDFSNYIYKWNSTAVSVISKSLGRRYIYRLNALNRCFLILT
jgi:hypothetical protein